MSRVMCSFAFCVTFYCLTFIWTLMMCSPGRPWLWAWTRGTSSHNRSFSHLNRPSFQPATIFQIPAICQVGTTRKPLAVYCCAVESSREAESCCYASTCCRVQGSGVYLYLYEWRTFFGQILKNLNCLSVSYMAFRDICYELTYAPLEGDNICSDFFTCKTEGEIGWWIWSVKTLKSPISLHSDPHLPSGHDF